MCCLLDSKNRNLSIECLLLQFIGGSGPYIWTRHFYPRQAFSANHKALLVDIVVSRPWDLQRGRWQEYTDQWMRFQSGNIQRCILCYIHYSIAVYKTLSIYEVTMWKTRSRVQWRYICHYKTLCETATITTHYEHSQHCLCIKVQPCTFKEFQNPTHIILHCIIIDENYVKTKNNSN